MIEGIKNFRIYGTSCKHVLILSIKLCVIHIFLASLYYVTFKSNDAMYCRLEFIVKTTLTYAGKGR